MATTLVAPHVLLAGLEAIDKPVVGDVSVSPPPADLFLGAILDTTPSTSSSSSSLATTRSTSPTIEPIASADTVSDTPIAGPSRRQRYLYIAIRRGHATGVFTSWPEAEKHIDHHPCPIFQTFSTRFAAEAYVVGWEGQAKHSLPASTPKALREHLAMTFPSSVPLPPPSIKRPSYHSRILDAFPPPPSDSEWGYTEPMDFAPAPILRHPRSTGSLRRFRTSTVYSHSPLRMEVDDDEPEAAGRRVKKVSSLIGLGGLLSPPTSPKIEPKSLGRPATVRAKSGLWATEPPHQSSSTPPTSPQALPTMSRRKSTLWDSATSTDRRRPTSQPGSDLATSSAPAFSRSALKRSGVVMPVAAPKLKSSSSLGNLTLRSKTSTSRPSASTSSLTSSNLNNRSSTLASMPHGQDRLATLVERSKREIERGVYPDLLGPPKPGFMRQYSNSSVSSLSSVGSLSPPSSITEEDEEEPVEILSPLEMGQDSAVIVQPAPYVDASHPNMSCTKSDGDAEGSVDSRSTKSGRSGGKPAKVGGGLFKRFSRALKKEKSGTA